MAKWVKGIVDWTEGDNAYISVVFTWDLPAALHCAQSYRNMGYRVSVGGPGVHVKSDARTELGKIARIGGMFESATAWGDVTLDRAATQTQPPPSPPPLSSPSTATTRTRTIYRHGTSVPARPAGGTTTENHTPTGWTTRRLPPTTTDNVYRSSRTETITNGTIEDTVVRHNPSATFASRGCPVGCWFCIVPSLEGREFTLLDDFPVRPILCDNNLSALPADFQDHIVRRYQDADVPLLDANSGFEPRTFTEDVFERWKPINKGPWRFACDDAGDAPHVWRTLEMLKKRVPNGRRKRVYTLIGNEPFDACMERIVKVIELGAEPHVQPLMKLNAPRREPWVRFDWTARRLRDVARWANMRYWKYCTFEEYDPRKRSGRGEQPIPMLGLA